MSENSTGGNRIVWTTSIVAAIIVSTTGVVTSWLLLPSPALWIGISLFIAILVLALPLMMKYHLLKIVVAGILAVALVGLIPAYASGSLGSLATAVLGASDESSSPNREEKPTTPVSNGSEVQYLPFVNEEIGDGDTRGNEAMPAVNGLLKDCEIPHFWEDLVACVNSNDADWYREGINRYFSSLGFNWADVEKWGAARTPENKSPGALVVFLSGNKKSLSDEEANLAIRGLLRHEDKQTAFKVVRLEGHAAFMNTWRESGGMKAYVDYGSQVRLSLVPLVLNEQGQAIGLDTKLQFNGVFVDCHNPHGLWHRVPAKPGGELPPVASSPANPPTPSPTPTPQSNGVKAPGKEPANMGNIPKQENGWNPPLAPKPKPPAVQSPAPQAPYVPPKPPAPKPTPRPQPPSTVAPGGNNADEGGNTTSCAPGDEGC